MFLYKITTTKPTVLLDYQLRINIEHYSHRTHATTSKYRSAAHPLCFTNEVLDHEFPVGFKPINIEAYDGTTDPAVWIEDFILHIHMARGDDLHAIKYLPLKFLPENSIGSWEELEDAFRANFQGTYVRPRMQTI